MTKYKHQIIILIGCITWILSFILDWKNIYPLTIIIFYISPPILVLGIALWLINYKNKKGSFPKPVRIYNEERKKHSGIFGTHFTILKLQYRYLLEGWTLFILFSMFLIILTGLLFKGSSAYKKTQQYFKENSEIRNETGGIKYFGILTSGSISWGNSNNPGKAKIFIKLIGQDKVLYAKVKLEKYDNWEIEEIEFK